MVHRNGDRYYLNSTEKGRLLLCRPDRGLSRAATCGELLEVRMPEFAEAEACFHESIKIAREQKAKS